MSHMDITPQILSTWRCNRLVFSPLRMYIVHQDRDLLAIVTVTVVPRLTNGKMVTMSSSLSD